jgi:hypothetical protein
MIIPVVIILEAILAAQLQISNATVTANPSSGTLGVGQTLVVDIQQLDHMTI